MIDAALVEAYAELASSLGERSAELAAEWRARHLGAVALAPDRAAVERAHARGPALLDATARALAAPSPGDWGGFSHREAVQIGTMMAWSLAEDGATPTAVGTLAPALGAALEGLGVDRPSLVVQPLAAVVTEGYAAALHTERALAEQRRLGASTPVLALPGGVVLVAASGRPEADAAASIVDRATDLALAVERPSVVVDLTHLEKRSPAALAALLGLADDVARLGGRCLFVGLTEEAAHRAAAPGRPVAASETRPTLAEALAEVARPRGLAARIAARLGRKR